MVRATKKVETADSDDRSRLKKLAITHNLLSGSPSRPHSILNPTKTVLKHDGRDIVKKSQRKNKFLFSFPGLLGPLTGGKIGELKDLGTQNPILYLDFPQGQMKLFGTIVYPKNRYLTLQFSKGGKSVVCEDNFDNMIVFSDAWWIGKKDENPDEVRLDFPKHLTEGKHTDSDFKGGAGSILGEKPDRIKHKKEQDEPQSSGTPVEEQDEPQTPEVHLGDDLSQDSKSLLAKREDVMELTPVRQSARTAGRKFKFTEPSSGDDSVESGSDTSEVMKKKAKEKVNDVVTASPVGKTDDSSVAAMTDSFDDSQNSSFTVKSKYVSVRKRGALVQATLSSLFEKADEKQSTGSARKPSSAKGTAQKSIGLKRKANPVKDEGPRKMGTPVKGKKSGVKNNKKKQSQVEDDDIEEFSSESEEIDESDEDWAE